MMSSVIVIGYPAAIDGLVLRSLVPDASALLVEPLSARGRWRVFLFAFVSILVPMLLWALASPLGSVPDEPSHAIRAAAVVRGEIVTAPLSADPVQAEADVPKYVAQLHAWTCSARKPLVTPACNEPVTGDPNAIVETGGSAGTNSPVFYAIVGTPTLFMEGTPALYAMRFVGALLCATAFGFMIMQLRTIARSQWAITGAIGATTPMVLYLGGSVNPNGIEAISAAALFVTLMAFVRDPFASRSVRWERAIGIVGLVVLLLSAKIFALLWLLLAVVAALVFLRRSDVGPLIRARSTWMLLSGSAVAAALSLAWFLHPPVYGVGNITPISVLDGFTSMVVRTFEFANGYVGIFGWLDTPSPRFSDIVWSTFAVVLITAGLIWGGGRARWVAFGFSAALLAVPPLVQAVLAPQVGFIWQGRYMLAVFIALLITCGMALDGTLAPNALSTRARMATVVGLGLLVAGHVATFVWVLRRYVVGLDGSIRTMLFNPTWQPPLGWATLSVLLLVWLTGVAVVLYRWLVTGERVRPSASAQRRPMPVSAHPGG